MGEWWKQNWTWIVLGGVGIMVLGYGLWGAVVSEPTVVEIVKSTEQKTEGEMVVDVAGSVMVPGVYKLGAGARIGDALVAAGGLAANADREWVAQTINLAQEVKDGGKIYIPAVTDNNQTSNIDNPTPLRSNELREGGAIASDLNNKRVNINTASTAELDRLAGIGEVRAQAIVANRPYGSTEELMSKARIPESVYEKIKDQVSVY